MYWSWYSLYAGTYPVAHLLRDISSLPTVSTLVLCACRSPLHWPLNLIFVSFEILLLCLSSGLSSLCTHFHIWPVEEMKLHLDVFAHFVISSFFLLKNLFLSLLSWDSWPTFFFPLLLWICHCQNGLKCFFAMRCCCCVLSRVLDRCSLTMISTENQKLFSDLEKKKPSSKSEKTCQEKSQKLFLQICRILSCQIIWIWGRVSNSSPNQRRVWLFPKQRRNSKTVLQIGEGLLSRNCSWSVLLQDCLRSVFLSTFLWWLMSFLFLKGGRWLCVLSCWHLPCHDLSSFVQVAGPPTAGRACLPLRFWQQIECLQWDPCHLSESHSFSWRLSCSSNFWCNLDPPLILLVPSCFWVLCRLKILRCSLPLTAAEDGHLQTWRVAVQCQRRSQTIKAAHCSFCKNHVFSSPNLPNSTRLTGRKKHKNLPIPVLFSDRVHLLWQPAALVVHSLCWQSAATTLAMTKRACWGQEKGCAMEKPIDWRFLRPCGCSWHFLVLAVQVQCSWHVRKTFCVWSDCSKRSVGLQAAAPHTLFWSGAAAEQVFFSPDESCQNGWRCGFNGKIQHVYEMLDVPPWPTEVEPEAACQIVNQQKVNHTSFPCFMRNHQS